MTSISRRPIPDNALLKRYAVNNDDTQSASYTDCYTTLVDANVRFTDFVFAFYTTPVFKLERLLLKLFGKLPSTDEQACLVAEGKISSFAAWTVEDRADNQLLMCDVAGRTRSWFMVSEENNAGASQTRVWFGSAVVAVKNARTGSMELGTVFKSLLGFHKLYSRVLLSVAKRRLEKRYV